MRLSTTEVKAIVETVHLFAPKASVRLFGSRVDDAKRGGDIDLLILNSEPIDLSVQHKIELRLHDVLGGQKIDILVEQKGSESAFGQLALRRSVPLQVDHE